MKLMIGDIYYSNNGRGPGMARVVSISGGIVALECRSSEAAKRTWRVALPEKFFTSSACGWKRRKARR